VPPHWLPPGGKTKTPPLVVSFDCETVSSIPSTGSGEIHRLRCWDAIVRDRTISTTCNEVTVKSFQPSKASKTSLRSEVNIAHYQGETAAELAELLEDCAETVPECWALAHNLGYDLTVTSLPVVLAARGWELKFLNLGDETCIFAFERGGRPLGKSRGPESGKSGTATTSTKRKLLLTDSWSWLRCSLDEAAKDVRTHKVKLPANDDSLEAWHRRCKRDVVILDKLLAGLMDWWESQQLGSFGITGPACGWRAMRQIVAEKSLLVGPEPFRTDFERSAIFGGRKEVYHVGTIHGTWIADYDFQAAYAVTAAGWPLPKAPGEYWPKTTWRDLDVLSPLEGAIVSCTVTTDRPCCPVKIEEEVWWPVGRFRTSLASPELEYVRRVASDVGLHHGQAYRLSYALADWAGWIIHLLGDYSGSTPAVVKRVAKGWGRSVLGRFALRKSSLIGERPAMHLGWHVETGHDLDTKDALEVISFNGVEYTYRKDTPGPDSSPAVLAFVEGYARRALAELLDTRSPAKLLQVNTDGWWEQKAVRAAAWQMPNVPWPYTVTRRALENELVVVGPNHVRSPHERRFAGVPRDASVGDEESFAWSDWPGLRWQIEHSMPGEYLRPPKEMVLREHYCRRWVLRTGETVPVSCEVSPAGETVLLPWSKTALRRRGDELADYQVPALEALRDEGEPFEESPQARTVKTPGRF